VTIKSAPYYWLICDHCGHSQADDDGDHSAWADEVQAVDTAEDWDWHVDGGHWCPPCADSMTCPDCGEFKGVPIAVTCGCVVPDGGDA
jgi:hypothetical protein